MAASALACSLFSPASSNMRWTCARYCWRSFDGLGVVLEVIIAVGQAQAALVGLGDHRAGVFEILPGAEFKERRNAVAVQVRNLFGKLRLVLQVADAVELRLERRQPFGVDGLLVHAGEVIIADLLRHGVAMGIGLGGLVENLAEDLAVALLQFGEAAPPGLVGRNGIGFDPSAAGVLVKVHARVRRFIQGLNVEGNGLGRGLGKKRAGAHGGKQNDFQQASWLLSIQFNSPPCSLPSGPPRRWPGSCRAR